MEPSKRKRVKKAPKLKALEIDPWVLVLLEKDSTQYSDTIQTFGFVRYNKPELRMQIEPFSPGAVMHVLKQLGIQHMEDGITEGVFTCDEMIHPTGEVWRFLARPCSAAGLHAASDFFINTYANMGAPQVDDYYKFGILDIVYSDADNLLPGETGYDENLDQPVEVAVIH